MKYLIIGGTGLISTPMSRFLLEAGQDVTLYNRGQREAHLPPGARIIAGDRKDFSAFENQIAEAGRFDFVIDMICFSPEEAESDVRAFKGRVDQLIFCSTVDVYCKPANHLPYREDEPRISLSSYGNNKIRCEDIFMAAHNRADFKTTLIRPAHTYGESGGIIHALGWSTTYLDRIRKGKPIVVAGDGQSLWVSCHIDDVARAHLAAAGNPRAYGRAYHATGEEWQTWDHYHRAVAEALGAPAPQLIHIPSDLLVKLAPRRAAVNSNNFQYSNIFDNAAAHADLNFRYTIPWKEGVRRTVAWLDAHNRIENSDADPFDDQVITAWLRHGEAMQAELAGKDG